MSAPPRTVAETSDFKATSRHADVLAFIEALKPLRPRMRVESMGRSALGQDMPVLIFGEPAPSKPVVLVIANIHAGEVEGKEAVLALARDLPDAVLDGLTLLLIPDYNPDGNDLIDPANRALDLAKLDGQIGPEGGVGTRYTGEGINLNRDYMKQEAPESRNLSRLFNAWNPHLTVDCHTTDGSIHGFALTYDTGHVPNPPCAWIEKAFLPEVSRRLEARTKLRTFFYGNFVDEKDPSKGWATYSHLPRYGSHYRGLRGRADILLESYSYIPFRERYVVTLEILKDILDLAIERGDELIRLTAEEERRRPDPVAVAYGPPLQDGVCSIPAWDLESQLARRIPGKAPHLYRVPHFRRFEPSSSVTRPSAYVVPFEQRAAVQALRVHGLRLEENPEPREVDAEVYTVERIGRVASPDCGAKAREETVLTVQSVRARHRIEKGDLLVRTDQPLGTLAVYLLEPGSDDGLARWGVFDAVLREGAPFPVVRLP
jgi:hypothetical protein